MAKEYAGFWLRFVASLIDGIILSIVIYPIGILALGIDTLFMSEFVFTGALMIWWIFSAAVGWLYHAFMESSEYQGTVGKIALSLKVTDMEGKRIDFGKATIRFFGKYISAIILYIGFLMIGFTKKKQGLHDIIAKTLVVKKAPTKESKERGSFCHNCGSKIKGKYCHKCGENVE